MTLIIKQNKPETLLTSVNVLKNKKLSQEAKQLFMFISKLIDGSKIKLEDIALNIESNTENVKKSIEELTQYNYVSRVDFNTSRTPTLTLLKLKKESRNKISIQNWKIS